MSAVSRGPDKQSIVKPTSSPAIAKWIKAPRARHPFAVWPGSATIREQMDE